MKILFVSALLPWPLVSGGQVRMYNLTKRLAKEHEITLCTYLRSEEEKKYFTKLSYFKEIRNVMRGSAKQLKYIIPSVTSGESLLTQSYDLKQMKDTVSELLSSSVFDLIHLEPFYVMSAIPKTNTPFVIAEHNIEHEVYRRYCGKIHGLLSILQSWDADKIQREEESSWLRAKSIIAVSDEDASVIRSKVKNASVAVVPNGVDTHWFSMKKHTFPQDLSCLFVGNFLWHPNSDALEYLLHKVWPKIMKNNPKMRLTIVGRSPPQRFVEEKTTGVTFMPHVEDIRDAMNTADVMLAPMRIAGGSKYKILEAMASGLPIITSSEGMSGLENQAKDCVFIADSDDEYVLCIQKILHNWDGTVKKAILARRFVEKYYDWDAISKVQDRIWKESI